MKILAVDQARHGAWAVYDYEGKKLLDYGAWGFDNKNYTFEQAILHIEALLSERTTLMRCFWRTFSLERMFNLSKNWLNYRAYS